MKILQSCGIFFITVFAGLFFSVLSFPAHAIVFDFSTVDSQLGSFSLSRGGIKLNVTAGTFTDEGVVTTGGVQIVKYFDGYGILKGVDNPRIDGSGANEVLLFEFSETVELKRVTFRDFGENDDFTLFVDDLNDGSLNVQGFLLGTADDTYTFAAGYVSTLFGIGARDNNDTFAIETLSVAKVTTVIPVSTVPLPPSVLLFAGALLGLGWIARRRKTYTSS